MLNANSIDILTVAHALHWFDIPATRKEFSRILHPQGWVVIIQNSGGEISDFEREEKELRKLHSRKKGKHIGETYASKQEAISALYGHTAWQECRIAHQHSMDWDTLVARILSNSAVPIEGEPGFDDLMVGLRGLFQKYQQKGHVTYNYETKIRWGHILCTESPTNVCTGAADAAR